MKYFNPFCLGILLFSLIQCTTDSKPKDKNQIKSKQKQPLFTLLHSSNTGVNFKNEIFENEHYNSFYYDYMYNGGGVAAGDIDNDGLVDLYFTGNMKDNRLYKNLGDMKFMDISNRANIGAKGTWSTGTTMADVNADGFLDIYVCRSYKTGNNEFLKNLLYINNGDLTFTEQGEKYGLADVGYSTQASFFDYDKDGDLDVFVANHPVDFQPANKSVRFTKWANPTIEESNHLYRNNGNNTFTDVTAEANLLSYDFTLGIITADMNGDGWPDIYLTNDFEHPDRYYINNGDGTFHKSLKRSFQHTSNFSMGVDYADINNDSLADLAVVDMIAEDNYRQKTMMPSMNAENFWRNVKAGYHYQYMRNTLQFNKGDGTFAEIGQLSGISKTDWSWAVLLADFNLDGWKDMFITNGYYRDAKNVDYRKYAEEHFSHIKKLTNEQIQKILSLIPQQKINNYYFENQGGLKFKNQSKEMGINAPSFSNGAAYADLDLDGDLDLVINNLGDEAFVYRNNSIENGAGNYLNIKLKGTGKNIHGIGTKITLKYDDKVQNRQHIVTRGYQSPVSNQIHFGLANKVIIDEITVNWPSGKKEILTDVEVNQLLTINERDARELTLYNQSDKKLIFSAAVNNKGIDYRHIENEYDDYEKEILLPHKMSQLGPKIAVGDVDGNGLDDVFIGAAAGSSAKLYLQNNDGRFVSSNGGVWQKDFAYEDLGSAIFDVDGDGDNDIYVVSGGNEFEEGSKLYQDRLYTNDGSGNFKRDNESIPIIQTSGSCVIPGDYDQDGDLDLFIGGRQTPGRYPEPANSYILENEGGVFSDVTSEVAVDLKNTGMVSSGIWSDYDGDNDLDLLVTGEWMAIRFFQNNNGKFTETTTDLKLDSTNGWWNAIAAADLNKDGLMDYVVGNLGENYKYKASKKLPFPIYLNDFDGNGTKDIVLGYENKGEYYPVRGRECSSQQMPQIKERFQSYHEFGSANLIDIYGEQLNSALHYNAYLFSSVILKNTGNGFEIIPMPVEAQFSAVQGILIKDFTKDGVEDILLAGNLFVSEVETGRADASTGLLLEGKGDFNYKPQSFKDCGFFAPSDVRDLKLLTTYSGQTAVLVANNNFKAQVFSVD